MKMFIKQGRKDRRGGKNGANLRAFMMCAAFALVMAATFGDALTVFAASTTTSGGMTDPVQIVNNFSTFIFGIIRAIGMVMLGFGIVQVGISLKGHDPSQRANGFLSIAGGIIITFAKEILDIIMK